jgi:hypothetical protein
MFLVKVGAAGGVEVAAPAPASNSSGIARDSAGKTAKRLSSIDFRILSSLSLNCGQT